MMRFRQTWPKSSNYEPSATSQCRPSTQVLLGMSIIYSMLCWAEAKVCVQASGHDKPEVA